MPFIFNPDNPPVLNIKGHLVSLTRPWVMGILNVTPDSFYPGSRFAEPEEAVARVGKMLSEGADIIDVGACSTRPGAGTLTADEELGRLRPVLEAIRSAYPEALLSLDTFRASVAEECIRRWDINIINDISGGEDPEMYGVAARRGVPYVLMHMRGTPADMDAHCRYDDILAEVITELAFKLNEARKAGVCDVIVDPGFGFAKTVDQNLTLLKHLDYFQALGRPLLVGISRKRMTGTDAASPEVSETPVSTIALNAVAIEKGASIIRVHDVEEAAITAKTIGRLWNLE